MNAISACQKLPQTLIPVITHIAGSMPFRVFFFWVTLYIKSSTLEFLFLFFPFSKFNILLSKNFKLVVY